MKSFGLGKKQTRNETPKRLTRPSNADLTQLITSAQKSPDKPFSIIWPSAAFKDWNYVLTVTNSTASKDRRGWTSSAIDKGAIGEAEWKLHREHNLEKVEVFTMPSSDALLIQTLIDEALQNESAPIAGGVQTPGGTGGDDGYSSEYGAAPAGRGSLAAAPEPQSASAASKGPAPVQEGNLRKTDIKGMLRSFGESKTTGRLLIDIGTVQAEVFFMNGQPVHAKQAHSFYDDRDVVGDSVLVEVLTWKEGTFKFQDGWPAASKSITNTLEAFLNGEVVVAAPEAPASKESGFPAAPAPNTVPMSNPFANDYVAPSASVNPAPAPPLAPPAPPLAPPAPATPPMTASMSSPVYVAGPKQFIEDFSNVDDMIGEVYASLVEESGYLKLGMFLMLARGEFVRHEISKMPFCIASIGLDLPSGQPSNDALRAVGECFEPVCQTLDCLGYASPNQIFALFPQTGAATAATILKHFVNNVLTSPLDGENHGSALKVSIGLCEVPRDGTDFEEILARASQLRKLATPERKVVTLA